ncbi:MAG: DUF4974 domain-containing protein, partial [Bacteroidota bacterium]|nr:DUF4974 domain-containing protein [Bacteroidota bacterium]
WYYYLLIQIPVYEYLPAIGIWLGMYFGFRHKSPEPVSISESLIQTEYSEHASGSNPENPVKTKISYNSADMKNIDFTGTFDQNKETLESFLNTLCILNELKIKKTNSNGFSIKEK